MNRQNLGENTNVPSSRKGRGQFLQPQREGYVSWFSIGGTHEYPDFRYGPGDGYGLTDEMDLSCRRRGVRGVKRR